MTDYAFTFNGLTFGGLGQLVQVAGVQGLEDVPDVRTADDPRGFADGVFYGRDFLGGRTITIDLILMSSPGTSMRQVLDLAKAAFIPQSGATGTFLPLQFTLPGQGLKRINCRLRRRSIPITHDYSMGQARGALMFYAADPRIYDDAPMTLPISLPVAASGRTYPRTYPMTYGAGGAGNTQVATNAGTVTTKPVITITGPVDTPFIQNITEGSFLKIGVVLGAADTLTIDTDARSIMLNGTASRRSALSVDSVWWDLQPGPNTLLYSAAAQTASIATVTWRNAYL